MNTIETLAHSLNALSFAELGRVLSDVVFYHVTKKFKEGDIYSYSGRGSDRVAKKEVELQNSIAEAKSYDEMKNLIDRAKNILLSGKSRIYVDSECFAYYSDDPDIYLKIFFLHEYVCDEEMRIISYITGVDCDRIKKEAAYIENVKKHADFVEVKNMFRPDNTYNVGGPFVAHNRDMELVQKMEKTNTWEEMREVVRDCKYKVLGNNASGYYTIQAEIFSTQLPRRLFFCFSTLMFNVFAEGATHSQLLMISDILDVPYDNVKRECLLWKQ